MEYIDIKEILKKDFSCGNRAVEKQAKKTYSALEEMERKSNKAKAGEFFTINDVRTRGHKALLTKRKKSNPNLVEHIPITHSPITRNQNNIKLNENPQKNDDRDCYILPKVQVAKVKDLGKKQKDLRITNAQDKAVIRHIKNDNKKRRDSR